MVPQTGQKEDVGYIIGSQQFGHLSKSFSPHTIQNVSFVLKGVKLWHFGQIL
jgi:hypothetical protein